MQRPKITISKKVMLDAAGHYRYYNPIAPRVKGGFLTLNLDPEPAVNAKTGAAYPHLNVKSEKELARFLLENFGAGIYRIVAHLKGREGIYNFWKGEVDENGWLCYNKEIDKNELIKDMRELEKIEEKLQSTNDEDEKKDLVDEKNMYEEFLNTDKEISREESKYKRYGVSPFLTPSGRRGSWHSWDEDDISCEADMNSGLNNNIISNVKPKKYEEMTVDDMNNF